MCYVRVNYADGAFVEVERVISASYDNYDTSVQVSETELSSHRFPVNTNLYFQRDNGITVVRGDSIRSVEIIEKTH